MNFSIGTAKGWDFGVDDFSTEYTRLSDVDITGASACRRVANG